jgi:antitoxin component HigA of HigAB toxin-antitoxin module
MMTKINNKQSYNAAMDEMEKYLAKGFSVLTEEEEEHLYKLSREVEAWELKEYSWVQNFIRQIRECLFRKLFWLLN